MLAGSLTADDEHDVQEELAALQKEAVRISFFLGELVLMS